MTERWPLRKSTRKSPPFFLHISSSYAKILGETNFQPRQFPRNGSKAKDRERQNDGNNNGQLRIVTPPRVAHAKPPGPMVANMILSYSNDLFSEPLRNEET